MQYRHTTSISVIAVIVVCLFRETSGQSVNLGTAGNFGVLGGSTVTNTGATTVTGDVGVSPGSAITNTGSLNVTGTIHAADSVALQAQNDLTIAYNDAAGRTGSTLGSAELGGSILVAGVYNSPTLEITGVLTLNGQGNPEAVWIFQSGSTLITASNSSVVLINGAQACHVFWQVGSSATLGTGSSLAGNVMALTSISATTGASVVGRLLARNGAVTLDTNTIAVAICQQLVSALPPRTDRTRSDVPSAAELARALILAAQVADVISAEGLTSIYTLSFAQFDTEVFSLQQRLADVRAGSRDAGFSDVYNPLPVSYPSENDGWGGKNVRSSGKNVRGSGKNVRGSGKDGWGGEGVQPREVQLAPDDRWGFFITGTGDFATIGDADGTSVGTTLGVDCHLTDSFLLGVSIGYARSESDLYDGSKVKSDGGKVALYGMYTHGGFYTEGLIGGGYSDYDTTRTAFLGDAHGSTDGIQFDSYVGVGYDVRRGGWTITPMASLLYTWVGIDGYSEVGSLVPLKVESQHADSLRSRIGPRVAYTTYWRSTMITPSVSAQWQHEFLDDELPFDARFANDNQLFTVHGPKIGRDSILLTAALHIAWSRYATYLAYQADLGRENYESHTGLLGFRVSW